MGSEQTCPYGLLRGPRQVARVTCIKIGEHEEHEAPTPDLPQGVIRWKGDRDLALEDAHDAMARETLHE